MKSNVQVNPGVRVKVAFKDSPRVRFNKGYWDAIILVARGFAHGQMASIMFYDPFYEAGVVTGFSTYQAGQKGDGLKAWNEFLGTMVDPLLLFQVEASKA